MHSKAHPIAFFGRCNKNLNFCPRLIADAHNKVIFTLSDSLFKLPVGILSFALSLCGQVPLLAAIKYRRFDD
jgi:hypothetical protein